MEQEPIDIRKAYDGLIIDPEKVKLDTPPSLIDPPEPKLGSTPSKHKRRRLERDKCQSIQSH